MPYPLSSEVTSGTPTLAAHYNNLRRDGLLLGNPDTDSVTVGAALKGYAQNVEIEVDETVADAKLVVPATALVPATLEINGCLCQNVAPTYTPLLSESGTVSFYVLARRNAGLKTFTIELAVSLGTDPNVRVIGQAQYLGSEIRFLRSSILNHTKGNLVFDEILGAHIGVTAGEDLPEPMGRGHLLFQTVKARLWGSVPVVEGEPANRWELIGGKQPSVRVTSNVSVSVPNNANTVVPFNSERWDTDEQHSNTVNNSRLTCVLAGDYICVANVVWGSAASGLRLLTIRKNGTNEIGRIRETVSTGDDEDNLTTHARLAVGDYLELIVYQSSGVVLNLNNYGEYGLEFSMVRVSA